MWLRRQRVLLQVAVVAAAAGSGHGDQALGSVEQVDRGGTICDEGRFQTQTLQQLHLHLRTGTGNGPDGVSTNGADHVAEARGLDGSHVA